MSDPSGEVCADNTPAQTLPSLTTLGAAPQPHIMFVPARTGTNIDLRIHTSLMSFDVAAGPWSPAAAGFTVTVVVHLVDTETGEPRHLPIAEPHEWARAIFSDVDAAQGYFLGAVDPDTGRHRDGQLAYRLYLDPDRRAIRVPRQLVVCPHYRLSTVDDGPEIRIVATA
ncbi:N-formylglutamate amidohydrolase [Rhodococcus sp. NPDC056960]|uniref:N-formylglutamate amidohydrolase n=1 Tax=Rhodococcus sp. NPDC056960 TaxID=3345982 RepID=UPI00362DA643